MRPADRFARAEGARSAYRVAVLLCLATLGLIVAGGLVTNTGSALAVPDWPTTFGHNMFLYPWERMVGGIFYEHSHRLLGALVGLLTIALAVLLWTTDTRAWLKRLGLAAVLIVGIQGFLGGLRVLFVNDALALIHGPLAQLFFALTVGFALFTSKGWAEDLGEVNSSTPSLRWLGALTTGAVFLQIVFGALLTHRGRLDAHLFGAAALLILVPLFGIKVLREYREDSRLTRPAIGMKALFAIQLVLGVGAYLVRFTGAGLSLGGLLAIALPVSHRLVGALLFGASLALTLKLFRLESSSALLASVVSIHDREARSPFGIRREAV